VKNLVIYGIVAAWFAMVAGFVIVFGILQKTELRPEQPIEFPHYVHAGELGMDCSDCHQYVEDSIFAGLPDAGLCMDCHEGVAEDNPEIIKLTAMYEAGEPVEWARVYRVKPHVYFSHKRHVRSDVRCQECHGPVELMTTIQRVTDLGMGWCLDCHKSRGAPIECITCHK
jgi:hypothetical protein